MSLSDAAYARMVGEPTPIAENEYIERLAAALIKKLSGLHHGYPPQQLDDAIAVMIQTAVADTYLVTTGVVSVENYEE